MANMMTRFLDFMKLGEDDDYDDDFYEEEEEEVKAPKKSRLRNNTSEDTKPIASVSRLTAASEDSNNIEPVRKERIVRSERSKIVPMRLQEGRGMELKIQKPTSFEDSEIICDILLKGSPVVVNLEGFNPDEAQRIMDFLYGCLYAIDGSLNQISKFIFVFSPGNVDVSGDISVDTNGVPFFNKDF